MPFLKRQFSKFTKPTRRTWRNQSGWQKTVTTARVTSEIAQDGAEAVRKSRVGKAVGIYRERRKSDAEKAAKTKAQQVKNRAAIRKMVAGGGRLEKSANGDIVVKAHDRSTAKGTVKVKQHRRPRL